jgi:hypothetical protein
MALDPSIPLQAKVPDTVGTLSSLVNLQQSTVGLQRQQMAQQQDAIDLQETKNAQDVMRNAPRDANGNIDMDKLSPIMAQAAPKNYSRIMSSLSEAQNAANAAKQSWNNLADTTRQRFGKIMTTLVGQSPDTIQQTFQSISQQPEFQAGLPAIQHFWVAAVKPALQSGNQQQIDDAMYRVGKMGETASTQQGMNSPSVATVATDKGTQLINTKAGVPGASVGPMGEPMTPPNQTVQTTGGGTALANPATGQVKPLMPAAPSAPQVDFPAGENGATQAELQLQRTAAQQAANTAPTMHNLNRSVISEVDNGITTGKLGELIQKVKSATGFAGDTGTDYNTLGKLLERSAITAAQGMGPHTNAGLEAQVRANGSTEYSPGAIRKIAALNDAAVTGSTLYQAGLENAITSNGGSVFAKRQFDQQWAKAMNPSNGVDGVQALRLKNAVDSGDDKEKTQILKEVGGPGSKGARELLSKLKSLHDLAGQ